MICPPLWVAEILKPNESLGLDFGPRGVNIIPESDLYRLIMRSHLPAAEAFQALDNA